MQILWGPAYPCVSLRKTTLRHTQLSAPQAEIPPHQSDSPTKAFKAVAAEEKEGPVDFSKVIDANGGGKLQDFQISVLLTNSVNVTGG